MTENSIIIDKLNKALSTRFDDYRGAYFFGSRVTGSYTNESDYDVVLVFDILDYTKQLEIAGIISETEYQLGVFFDCKLLTSTGKKSIEYLRENINPLFIQKAVDAGIFYART